MHARAPCARVKISTRIFGLPMILQAVLGCLCWRRAFENKLRPEGRAIDKLVYWPDILILACSTVRVAGDLGRATLSRSFSTSCWTFFKISRFQDG